MFDYDDNDPSDYVLAFRAHSVAQAEMLCQLLEDHEIPSLAGLAAEDALDGDAELGPSEGIPICVPGTLLEEAREIVADLEDFEDFEDFDDTMDMDDEESEIDFDDGMSEATEESLVGDGEGGAPIVGDDEDDDDEMIAAVSGDLDPLAILGLSLDDDMDMEFDGEEDFAIEFEDDEEDL